MTKSKSKSKTIRKLTQLPMSREQLIEFLGFSNWPYNLDKQMGKIDVELDPRAANEIWAAALNKSITPSIKPEEQLRFLITTLWCLQTLEMSEGTGRKIKLEDFLFCQTCGQLSVKS